MGFKQLNRACFVGVVLLFFFTALPLKAQSTAPTLSNLLVELWPEYDRAEVLVIYRIELSERVTLPVTLSFRLPGYVETMHAVAFEQNGNLFALEREQISLQQEGEAASLTIPVTSRRVQLEYYDRMLMNKTAETRTLAFDFVAPYDVETLTFQVQAPLQAENFRLTPPATNSFSSGEGFTYHELEINGVTAGDPFELTATYRRATDELSTALLGLDAEHAADVFVAVGAETGPNFTLAYGLIGLGLLLLVFSGGSYLWTHRARKRTLSRPAASRPPAARSQKREKQPPQAALTQFCYRCGKTLRPDAHFCHACGAPRRKEEL